MSAKTMQAGTQHSRRVEQLSSDASTEPPDTSSIQTKNTHIFGRYAADGVLAWGGDVNLGRRQHYRTRQLGEASILPISELSAADLTVINLECVISTLGEQGAPKGEGGPYYYRARPEMARILMAAGVDLVTVANNHSGDYGAEALLQQKAILKAAGIDQVGSGQHRDEAFEPVFLEAGNVKVAIFSIDATQHRFAAGSAQPGIAYLPLNQPQRWYKELQPRIKQAKSSADLAIVAVHWGANGLETPDAQEVATGHALIDAGADAVLGASAHCLQGIEVYRNRPIIHDAGDLLFDAMRQRPADGGIFQLGLTCRGVSWIRFIPLAVGFGKSRRLMGAPASAVITRYAERCKALGTQLKCEQNDAYLILQAVKEQHELKHQKEVSRQYRPEALIAYQAQRPGLANDVPRECRIKPVTLNGLTLLGLRVTPSSLSKRSMLWVETWWTSMQQPDEPLRLDYRAVPWEDTRKPYWGRGMDHDPCDWMQPSNEWKPAHIYRDFYGLRPPPMKQLVNGPHQLEIRVLGEQSVSKVYRHPTLINVDIAALEPPIHTSYRTRFSTASLYSSGEGTWNAAQIANITGGRWLVAPPKGWYVNSIVAASSHLNMVPTPTLYVAHTHHDRARHEQYSNLKRADSNPWDSHSRLPSLHDRLAGAIVARPIGGLPDDFPVLQVNDSFQALLEIGIANRSRLSCPVVAVTGSAGKTSTVDMISTVFGNFMSTHATYGNYNSRCGMLISLASASPSTSLVVLEAAVTAINSPDGFHIKQVAPDIAIITNIGTSHLKEGQTTLDTARRKSNIFQRMSRGKTAIICRDSDHYEYMADRAKRAGLNLITYGENPCSDIFLQDYDLKRKSVKARTPGGIFSYRLSAPGRHMALNSLVCLALSYSLKLPLEKLLTGFSKTSPSDGRGQVIEVTWKGKRLRIIDESYNANPLSMRAALELMAAYSDAGRNILILGEMLEQGSEAETYHDALLPSILACRPARVHLIGALMSRLEAPLTSHGIECTAHATRQGAWPAITHDLQDTDNLLFKGSNSVGLHALVRQLCTDDE
ncbi:CapA family protein [Halomonas sp. Y3]|uniref:CapA family protein n=1 Tax=Halomonas sp. Y3 TaxID=2956797 RepID=UPI00209E99DA|nr:CapA family protein [Halomonas sp. Y3]